MKFSRGYSESRERVRKGMRYARSCFNCEYYLQGEGDKEEVCQNPNVLEFDMTVEDNNIYCTYWQQYIGKDEGPVVIKLGRSVLD